MSRLNIITYFLLFSITLTKAQDSSRVKVYKKNKFEILGMDEHITLYKKVNTQLLYFLVFPFKFLSSFIAHFCSLLKIQSIYSVKSFINLVTSGFVCLLKSNGFKIYPAISKCCVVILSYSSEEVVMMYILICLRL